MFIFVGNSKETDDFMRELKIFAIIVFFLTALLPELYSQSFRIEATVKNLPGDEVIIGAVKGDKFTPADTVLPVSDTIAFEIPEGAQTGVYRIILGQTVYANVMHEPPQKLDFIFNNDSCVFETDFNAPLDSMDVVYSKENEVWYRFLKKEEVYQKQLNDLKKQIDYFREYPDDKFYTEVKRKELIKKYNSLQKERSHFIASLTRKFPKLFAAKMIAMHREPFLDGNLSESERSKIYKRSFFKHLDFSDKSLLNTEVYTQKAYEYLMSYADRRLSHDQQLAELNKAVDVIIENTKRDPEVSDFIVDYLMRGFEKLGLEEQLLHIAEKYTPAVPCTADEKSTLQRRIDLQKMTPGTEVPSFSLIDINGDSTTLSDVTASYKLIVFWATWCPHCEQLLPNLYQWYINRGVDIEVIAVSVDSDVEAWKQFVKERGYNWINCNEPGKWDGKVTKEYNIYATPTMFLIDHENKIVSKPLSFNEFLDAVINLSN